MTEIQFEGKVDKINPKFTKESFSKVNVIFEIKNGNYIDYMSVDFVNKDMAMTDGMKLGDSYDVTVSYRGNKQIFKNGEEGVWGRFIALKCAKTDLPF